MADKDTASKAFMSDAAHFADAFNFYMFDGEQRIKPEQLRPYQTSDVCLGFCHDNELIQIIYFNLIESHLVMNICTKFGYNVINGTKDIINYYLRNSGYNYILVYCDMSKFTGKTFEDLEFKFLQYQEPSIISELSEESNTYKQLYNCGYNIYIINL